MNPFQTGWKSGRQIPCKNNSCLITKTKKVGKSKTEKALKIWVHNEEAK